MDLAESDSYMVMDVDSGNSVSIFEEYDEALAFLGLLTETSPWDGHNFALIAFDKSGFAVDALLPKELA